jgi:23S rRNA (cytidine1920-2'-O)/16S rRNA (cytidine1409-2'-O)-methyltransferase
MVLRMEPKSHDAAKDHDSSPRKSKAGKIRLDLLIVERGLAPSRQRAQAMLLAGQIRVNGQRQDKAGTQVANDAAIDIVGETLRYASRGGLKLEGALTDFGVDPQGKTCADIGSSNGGFTDCLLQHGASKVYAVDVTIDQLDWKLRQDARVVTIEKNARSLALQDLGKPVDLITVDVSFISVAKILPAISTVAKPGGEFLILVKPQFELEKRDIGKGGIVRDPALHEKAVERVREAASAAALEILGCEQSHLPGAEGNLEFFLHARAPQLA